MAVQDFSQDHLSLVGFFFFLIKEGASDMAQKVKVLAAKPVDPCSGLRTLVAEEEN